MNNKAIMIAGTNSGCGKTTITCAVLKALMNKGLNVAAFKCGPDYIDPMFHTKVIGVPSRNIDFFLCGETKASQLFAKNSQGADISIIEGVMGFYDGMGGTSSQNSSCHISGALGVPVVLVVDCKGASLSVAATVQGYKNFMKNNISGVILNNVSTAMYGAYKEIVESNTGIMVCGYMPRMPRATLESRHLGLITAQEVQGLKEKIDILAQKAQETIDLNAIINLSGNTFYAPLQKAEGRVTTVKIAIARDNAFCFYYKDALELLETMGVKLVSFSPIKDKILPRGVSGLIIGGGYPELYADKLSENKEMLSSIKAASSTGMPIFAECGGFMYLGTNIGGKEMCGVIPMESAMTTKLQNFGYVTLTSLNENMLLEKGEEYTAHEFHYSACNLKGGSLEAKKTSGKAWKAGYCTGNIFALYPHLHMNSVLAKRFINKCEEYRRKFQ